MKGPWPSWANRERIELSPDRHTAYIPGELVDDLEGIVSSGPYLHVVDGVVHELTPDVDSAESQGSTS